VAGRRPAPFVNRVRLLLRSEGLLNEIQIKQYTKLTI
jgi:hypothetical protein